MPERKKIGELLVEGKVITSGQLTGALAHQKQWGGRLGTALIEKGFITEDVLAKFLSFQLNFPSVNLGKIQVLPEVISRVPREMQEKHLCVPIAVMKEGRTDALILAIANPTDLRAIDEIGFATGLKIKPVIATESALKRFLFGGTNNAVRNVGFSSGMKTVNERTDEFEVVRGSVAEKPPPPPPPAPGQPQAMGVIGEETIDFETDGGGELLLEAPVAGATPPRTAPPVPPPVAKPAPPPPPADPFAAALVARASGSEMASGPIPGAAPAFEGSYPTLDPGALAPVQPLAPTAAGTIPSNGFETDDRTEPDIMVGGGSPPPVAEPEAAPWDPEPSMPSPQEIAAQRAASVTGSISADEPIPEPDREASLLDAWAEPPDSGAVPADDGAMPEISLPGPEMQSPPPDVLQQPVPSDPLSTPSRVFAIPEDLQVAEPSHPPAAEPAPPAWEPEPEAAWEPQPEAWEPQPQPIEPKSSSFDPGVESGFEPTVPDQDMPAPEQAAALDAPQEIAPQEIAPKEIAPQEPPSLASTEIIDEPHENRGQAPVFTAEAPVEEPPSVPLAADGGGAIPVPDPSEAERTVVGMGAMEPTWTGEEQLSTETKMPEKTVLGAGSAEPMWTPGDQTDTADFVPRKLKEPEPEPVAPPPSPEPEPDRETIESFELPPPKPLPPPAAKLSPPKVEVSEPSVEEPSRPTAAPSGISDEQALLNTTFTKKLKLLNAIAELLLEKGLITEEEIKEKIAKKK